MSDSVAATPSPTPRRPARRWLLALVLLLPLAALGYLGWKGLRTPAPVAVGEAEDSELRLDLTRPDALIESRSLAQMPRDLLRVPVLKDLLSEDFVFYYQSNADRLGVLGSLRRIAYEHELELQDSLVQELLDQPAQVALWRTQTGKLDLFVMRLQRGALAKLLQPLLQAAANDTQLSVIGERKLGRDSVPVFRLRYGYQRALLFAVHGDQMLLFSDPRMLQASADPVAPLGRRAAEQLDQLLDGDIDFARRFGLDDLDGSHRLTVSMDYLAMGYGRFLPQVAGLSFLMQDEAWSSQVALSAVDAAALQFAPLWQAAPLGASACVAVPVAEQAVQSLVQRMSAVQAVPATLAAQLKGPAALCWYPDSRLYSPLLITRLADAGAVGLDEQLGQGFERVIGSHEANAEGGRFAVETLQTGAGSQWQRVVGSDWGLHAASEFDDPDSLANEHFFRIALARQGELLLFSMDHALVEQAIAVLEKRYPPLAEKLPADRVVPLYLAPEGLAGLVEREVLRSLPADVEAVFRNAAEAHLLPKLRAMGEHPPLAMSVAADTRARREWTWIALDWNRL